MEIKPNEFYGANDLALGLGISMESIDRERQAGRLRAIQRGTSHTFRGEDVLDWLSNRTPREIEQRRAARDRGGSVPGDKVRIPTDPAQRAAYFTMAYPTISKSWLDKMIRTGA